MKDPATWGQIRVQIAEEYKATRKQRAGFRHVYSTADLDRIAKALRKSPSEIHVYKPSFENCAYWYRLCRGFDKERPEQIPPSKMHERLVRICKAADRLLRAFAVGSDAGEGMGEGALGEQIFEAVTWCGPEVPEAVARDLRQLAKAREAAQNLLKRAKAAAADIEANELKSHSGRGQIEAKGQWSVPDGNQNDAVLNDWIACSMRLYEEITGKRPKTSVRGPTDKRAGEADGPLLRFLAEAGRPLGIQQSSDALRARVRRVQRSGSVTAGTRTKRVQR